MTSSLPLDPGTLAERLNRLLPVFFASSRERLSEFIALYLEQSYNYLDQAKTALEANDVKGIRSAVHAWRPAMPMLGLDELHELAQSIETRIDEGDLSITELTEALKLLSDETTACAALIRSYRREL
ncbi:MAG: Hpt domain-containing protein [Flavobacteriales bacterium]